MNSDSRILRPEDYTEPQCPLCDVTRRSGPAGTPIPQQRVREKLDDYMSRRDYAGAERHLLYWLEEARACGDQRGELMVLNELVGHYRKTGDRDNSLAHGEAALQLLEDPDYSGTLTAATTYVNVATACNAFGDNQRSLELFRQAQPIYEATARTAPDLLGGLYNNMALTLVALGRFQEAHALYDQAMAVMALAPGGVLEQAITCLNRADALAAECGMEHAEGQIYDLVDQAYALLLDPSAPRDGYYAFVCEKCVPSFSFYGYFAAAEELAAAAEEIYERS